MLQFDSVLLYFQFILISSQMLKTILLNRHLEPRISDFTFCVIMKDSGQRHKLERHPGTVRFNNTISLLFTFLK